MHTIRSLAALSSILETRGAAAAIQHLNAGVAHRFTAVYRLDGDILRNVLLWDKQGEIRPAYLAEVPLATSFCQFVLRDGVFRTTNSATDSRLDGHPYQGVMVCYHGVPLLTAQGELWGTLCHFDVQELPLSDAEFDLLQQTAQLLPGYLPQA
ncbi:GAF domain-containing protein [Rhodoferax sp. WC2427]|uniref:GAF domain-containing protein n=1 Tax=Rhodoferax sp. WC2427 TaxID=3234144 RepID=UPI0034675719